MKIYKIFIIALFSSFLTLFAQVDLEINNNMSVETTGGLYIELSGDLIENGSGYLKGTVTSGTRGGGISSFAGLNLASGSVSKITRNTGNDFNGNTAPKTTFRNYQLVNSSSQFTGDVSADIVNSGTFDESNNVVDKYIFTEKSGTFKGYSDNGSTANQITGNDVVIQTNTSNILISEGIGVGAKIFLEGPYAGSSLMNQTLKTSGDLDLNSPYTEAPRTASAIPTNAVDWVLVELRNGIGSANSLGYRSAFVDINGNVIDDLGNTGIGFPAAQTATPYYLVVKHRNHLPVMSNTTNSYSWISTP